MSNFNQFQDAPESNTSYQPAAGQGQLAQLRAKVAPRDPTFTPAAVAVTFIALTFALVATVLAGTEWGYHDVHGECKLINSGMQYIAQIDGCCPADQVNTIDKAKCNSPAQPGFPSNMKDCLKKVCKKSDDIYFGQCHAPQLAISGGVFGMVAALISAAGWHYPDWRRSITGCVALLGLASFFICGAAFVTSLFRFGNGNTHDRENIVMVGPVESWPNGPNCNYTYEDTRGDWKAMTAFCFLSAAMSLVLSIHTCLWSNRLGMYDTQTGMEERAVVSDMNTEFLKGSEADRGL